MNKDTNNNKYKTDEQSTKQSHYFVQQLIFGDCPSRGLHCNINI